MGYRVFTDSQGREWQAWDVVPQLTERRGFDRRVRIVFAHRDDDTLAGREAIGLDDDRCAARCDECMRGRGLGERSIRRRRNAVPRHERLREILRALETRGRARRSEDAESSLAKCIDDAGGKRGLGANDR